MAQINEKEFQKSLGEILGKPVDDDGIISTMQVYIVGNPTSRDRETDDGQIETRTQYEVFDQSSGFNFAVTVKDKPLDDLKIMSQVSLHGIRGGVWHTESRSGVWINAARIEVES